MNFRIPTTSDVEEFVSLFSQLLREEAPITPPSLHGELLKIASGLYVDEFYPPEEVGTDALSKARHKDACASFARRSTDDAADTFIATLAIAFKQFIYHLPRIIFDNRQPLATFQVDLTREIIDALTIPFEICPHRDLFVPLRRQLMLNRQADIARSFSAASRLKHTNLEPLLTTTLPFNIPIKTWKEHGFLFAKSGHGKSQTLRAIVASLLEEDCALFLLDGNGALIKDLERINSIQDRLVILDPDDTPQLNFFRMHVSPEQQLELYFYLFKALDQSLSARMETMVSYLIDLMRVIDGSNLDTLRQICEAKQFPFPDALQRLDDRARDFFTHHFNTKDQFVTTTKASLAQRIHRMSSYPKFLAMMNAPTNDFDALRCMQEKKIVIVNTSRRKLGDDGSTIFGRFILAQCLAAAWHRSDTDHLALVVVDEAKTYLDDHSKKFLSDTRNFNVGLLLATQFADQLEDGVRKEVINNTSVKIAGPMAYSVVAQINRDMRCDPDFILGMKKKDNEHTDWACYIDNVTPVAVRMRVPFATIEKLDMIRERHRPPRPEPPKIEAINPQSPPAQQEAPTKIERQPPPPPPPPQRAAPQPAAPPKQSIAEPADLPDETEY